VYKFESKNCLLPTIQIVQRRFFASNVETGATTELLKAEGGEEDSFSPAEKLRRERARQYSTGVSSYGSCAAPSLIVPMDGALWILDGVDASAPRLLCRAGRNATLISSFSQIFSSH
jgi:hypothetical protein